MTIEQTVAIVAGAIASLFFEYFPGASEWYAARPETQKRLVMLATLLIAVVGMFAVSCIQRAAYFPCTWGGAYDAVVAFVLAAMSSQGVHRLTKRPTASLPKYPGL